MAEETFGELFDDFLESIAYVKGSKLDKPTMIVKIPRLLCDALANTMSYGIKDHDTIVDALNGAFKDAMSRENTSTSTYGTAPGCNTEKIVDWMDRFASKINASIDGNPSRLRSVRDDVILPAFKGRVLRKAADHRKKMKAEVNKSQELRSKEQGGSST